MFTLTKKRGIILVILVTIAANIYLYMTTPGNGADKTSAEISATQ